jgi:hypothetical protein
MTTHIKTKPVGTYDSAFKVLENMREQRDKLREQVKELLGACKAAELGLQSLERNESILVESLRAKGLPSSEYIAGLKRNLVHARAAIKKAESNQ